MKIKFIGVFFALLLALTAGALAYASPPEEVSGTFGRPNPIFITDEREAGPNTFITFTRVESPILGDVEGLFDTVESTRIILADGTVIARGTLSSNVTIAGKSGTLMWKVLSTTSEGVTTGKYTWFDATGDLEGIHGNGTYRVSSAGATYSGSFHFAP